MPEETLKTYYHQGEELGKIVETTSMEFVNGRSRVRRYYEFRTNLNELDIESKIYELSPEERIHLKERAPELYEFLQEYSKTILSECDADKYITKEDLTIFVADRGYKNITAVKQGDHKVWRLIKNRKGLEKKIFSQLKQQACYSKCVK